MALDDKFDRLQQFMNNGKEKGYVLHDELSELLPADLNKVTTFAAAVIASSKNPEGAQALLKYLQSPEATKVFKASGFELD